MWELPDLTESRFDIQKSEHTVPTLFSRICLCCGAFCFVLFPTLDFLLILCWVLFTFQITFLKQLVIKYQPSWPGVALVGGMQWGVCAQGVWLMLSLTTSLQHFLLPNRSTKDGDYCPLEKEFPCPPRKLSTKCCEGEEKSLTSRGLDPSPSTATSWLKALGKSPPLSMSYCSLAKWRHKIRLYNKKSDSFMISRWNWLFGFFLVLYLFKILFVYLFLAVLGSSCRGEWGLHGGVWASPCGGSPCCGAQALGPWASILAACGR